MITHGFSNTPTYHSWERMIARCYDSNNASYQYYGEIGIEVCARWREIGGFQNFLTDMGEKPKGLSLDRFPDKKGNYEPGNCRWATWKQQARNKSNVPVFLLDGESITQPDLADKGGISVACLKMRLRYGWTLKQAIGLEPRKVISVCRFCQREFESSDPNFKYCCPEHTLKGRRKAG